MHSSSSKGGQHRQRCCCFQHANHYLVLAFMILCIIANFSLDFFLLKSSSSSSIIKWTVTTPKKTRRIDDNTNAKHEIDMKFRGRMTPASKRTTTATNTTTTTTTTTDDDINFLGGIVGVLTVPQNYHLRNKYRSTWIESEFDDEHYYHLNPDAQIKVFFLLDFITPELQIEQQRFGDLIFLNNTATGFAVKFGEKLSNWIHYAHERFPNSAWIAKMDDDVAFCPTTKTSFKTSSSTKTARIWDIVYEHQSPALYLGGHMHDLRSKKQKKKQRKSFEKISWENYRMDEMFVVLGSELVEKLSQRQYCDRDKMLKEECIKKNGLWDTHYGGTSLGLWLEPYNSPNLNIVPLNDRVIHYGLKDLEKREIPDASTTICHEYDILLYHKANIDQMDVIWG